MNFKADWLTTHNRGSTNTKRTARHGTTGWKSIVIQHLSPKVLKYVNQLLAVILVGWLRCYWTSKQFQIVLWHCMHRNNLFRTRGQTTRLWIVPARRGDTNKTPTVERARVDVNISKQQITNNLWQNCLNQSTYYCSYFVLLLVSELAVKWWACLHTVCFSWIFEHLLVWASLGLVLLRCVLCLIIFLVR